MFRLWKGRKDAENKTNNLNEKNTHEINLKLRMMAQMVQIWINQAAILLIFATFSRSTILAAKRSVPMMM